ncbi:hypothetical protein [Piscinibacter sp. XHJ-5]|uniref:hypothetical protein n=1 Tax=Piscinibacter sp. XHJ-5 TaxID=3037797 RepID=UPI0024530946|nr:hypothetical protein [Piscinibacter sp. XHJ-5]
MISRLSALAAVFAVVTTASLAYAANVQQERALQAACNPMPVLQFEPVTIIGKRADASL